MVMDPPRKGGRYTDAPDTQRISERDGHGFRPRPRPPTRSPASSTPISASTSSRAGTRSRTFRSRCTAGRETTSAASRRLGETLGGGLAATGNYPGKARTARRAPRATPTKALSLIPGTHRFNLHAFYGEFGGQAGRPRRDRPGAFRRLDRLGEVARHRARLQPDVLLASQGRATTSRCRIRDDAHPRVLDPARASPAARSARRWARRSARRA